MPKSGEHFKRGTLLVTLALFVWGIWLFLSLDALPYLDLTNHVGRACTISRLWTSAEPFYRQEFAFRLEFYSYILSDLMLAAVCTVASPSVAGAVNMAIGFALLPVAAYVYLRALGKTFRVEILLLLMIFLSTNWHFVQGFLAFHMGIATTLLALAALDRRIRRASALNTGLFVMAAAVCYAMHLASFVVLLAMWVIAAARDFLQDRKLKPAWFETGGVLGLICVYQAAQSILQPSDISGDGGIVIWRSLTAKALAVGTMFVRFSQSIDLALFVLFLVVIALLGWGASRPRRLREFLEESFLAEAALMLVLFLVVPLGLGTTYHLDERFLPYFFLFLCLYVVSRQGARWQGLALGLGVLLCTLNLAYLSWGLHEENTRGRAILAELYSLPAKQRVLPVASQPNDGRMQAFNHLGGLYTPERGGMTPYIQGGDNKNPMRYFSYLHRPYAPDVFWYQRTKDAPEWNKIRASYDLLFIPKPYDASRLDLAGSLDLWRSGSAADVYRVRKP